MDTKFKQAERIISKTLAGFVSLLLFLLLVLVTGQIISRQFGIRVLAPPDEIVTLVFAWMVFIGSTLLVRDNSHLRVELVDLYLVRSRNAKLIYDIVVGVLMLLFLGVMVKSGWRIVAITGSKTSPMLRLPQRLWYYSLPISGVLMMLYSIMHIVDNIIKLLANEPTRPDTSRDIGSSK